MLEALEVLKIVGERLEAAQLPYMLTSSFAMVYYGKPRMTRDLSLRAHEMKTSAMLVGPERGLSPRLCCISW